MHMRIYIADFRRKVMRKVDPTADLQVTTTALTFDCGYQKIEGSACDEFGTIGSLLWGGRHGMQCACKCSLYLYSVIYDLFCLFRS